VKLTSKPAFNQFAKTISISNMNKMTLKLMKNENVLVDSYYSSLHHNENVTFTEWSLLAKSIQMASLSTDQSKSISFNISMTAYDDEQLMEYLNSFGHNYYAAKSNPKLQNRNINSKADVDKGSTSSYDSLVELRQLNGDFNLPLNIFRRNIALRNNRVLHPAR
jgi:hypothetical protein